MPEPVDLDLYVDSSGSMPDPQQQVSYPALAGAIVEWRAANGGFASVDQLEAVPGIGPAKLASVRDLGTV